MEGGGTSNRLNMFFFSRGKRDLNKFAPAISLKPKSGRCNPPKNVNMLICNPPPKTPKFVHDTGVLRSEKYTSNFQS